MAVKSIIQVEVQDEEFTRFKALFDDYSAALEKTGEQWDGTNTKLQETQKIFNLVTAAMLAQSKLRERQQEDNQKEESHQRTSLDFWNSVVSKSNQALVNVGNISKRLLEWGGIGLGVLGIGGAGSLWGLDSLANGINARRRSALGLGLSYGEQQAFSLNYSRFVNPDSFLGGVNEALHDPSKRVNLYQAGLPEGQIKGDTAQVSVEALKSLQQLAKSVPENMLGTVYQNRNLSTLLSYEEFQRLGAMSTQELNEQGTSYNKDRFALGLTPANQKAWANFSTQMHRAGSQIENTFVTGLSNAHIPEALTKLSDAASKAIGIFLKSPNIQIWIDELGKGLQSFAGYIGGKQFQSDIKTFVDDVGYASHKMADALKWLGLIPSTASPATTKSQFSGYSPPGFDWHGGMTGFMQSVKERWYYNTGRASPITGDQISQIESAHKLPAGLLKNVYGAESGYGANAGPSKAGAVGAFQFMPSTGARYGITNPYDTLQEANAAGAYFDDLLKEFKGNLKEAIAAYNWGEGHLQKDISQHGAQWENFLPKETKDYLTKVLTGAKLAQGVKVVIQNNTGGSAVVQTSQLAH